MWNRICLSTKFSQLPPLYIDYRCFSHDHCRFFICFDYSTTADLWSQSYRVVNITPSHQPPACPPSQHPLVHPCAQSNALDWLSTNSHRYTSKSYQTGLLFQCPWSDKLIFIIPVWENCGTIFWGYYKQTCTTQSRYATFIVTFSILRCLFCLSQAK